MAGPSTGRIVAGSNYRSPAHNTSQMGLAHSKHRGTANLTGAGEPFARRNPTTTTKVPSSPGYGSAAKTPRYRRGRKRWIPTKTSTKGSIALAFAPS